MVPLLTYDALLATQGLIEGEATLVEDRAYTESVGFEFETSHYERALASFREYTRARLIDAEDLFGSMRSGVPSSTPSCAKSTAMPQTPSAT